MTTLPTAADPAEPNPVEIPDGLTAGPWRVEDGRPTRTLSDGSTQRLDGSIAAAQVNPECTPWCERREIADHCADPACWGEVDYYVPLTLEEGYPAAALPARVMEFDPPRIGVHAYRRQPGCQEVVLLHVYRAHDNDHIAIDDNLSLTVAEAEELIDNLRTIIDLIDGAK